MASRCSGALKTTGLLSRSRISNGEKVSDLVASCCDIGSVLLGSHAVELPTHQAQHTMTTRTHATQVRMLHPLGHGVGQRARLQFGCAGETERDEEPGSRHHALGLVEHLYLVALLLRDHLVGVVMPRVKHRRGELSCIH